MAAWGVGVVVLLRGRQRGHYYVAAVVGFPRWIGFPQRQARPGKLPEISQTVPRTVRRVSGTVTTTYTGAALCDMPLCLRRGELLNTQTAAYWINHNKPSNFSGRRYLPRYVSMEIGGGRGAHLFFRLSTYRGAYMPIGAKVHYFCRYLMSGFEYINPEGACPLQVCVVMRARWAGPSKNLALGGIP